MTIAIEIDRHDRTSVRISGPHAFAAGETYDPLVLLHADGLSPSTLRVLLRRPGVPGMPVVSSASGFRSVTRSEIHGGFTLCTEEMASWCADALGFSESDADPSAVPVSAEARLEVYDGERLAASSRVPVVLRWMTPGMDPAAEGTSTATALDAYPVRDPDPGAPRRALVTSDGVARAISDALGALDPSAMEAIAVRLAALEGSDSDVSAREIARSEVALLVDGAPEALDTLKELADRLGSEGDALAVLVSDVAALKAAGGEANVQADWSESDPSSDAYIRNRPDLKPTVDSALSATSENPVQNKVVTEALDARPTKGQIDEGWWSGWTVTCGGVDVTSQVPQPQRFVSDVLGWAVPIEYPTTFRDDVVYDEATGYGNDALLLEWTSSAGAWSATRHRVAAPVPTRPEDISAQPAGSYATAAQGAKADAALSRAEAEAGFTAWSFDPPTINGKVCSVVFDEGIPAWVLYLDNEPTSEVLRLAEDATQIVFDDNYTVTATRIRLPTMADIPTKTSDLTNDSGFLTQHQDISGKLDKTDVVTPSSSANGKAADAGRVYLALNLLDTEKAAKSEMSVTTGTGADADKATIQLKTGASVTVLTQHQSWSDVKPSGGIPKTDMASAVQTSLGKADTAVQPSGIAGLMPMYPFEAGTFVGAHWTFSSGSLVPDRHFEIIFDSTDNYWYLLDFPDSSTFDPSEDISNYANYVNDEAQGTAADTSVTFSTANVTATLVPNTMTVSPFKVNGSTPASGASFTVAMGALPAGVTDVARDAVLVIDCSTLDDSDSDLDVSWGSSIDVFEGGSAAAVAPENGKVNLYRVTEYASGRFVVRTLDAAFLAGRIPASAIADFASEVAAVSPPTDISGKLDSTSAAQAYSAQASYQVGAYVTYNGVLYECKAQKAPGATTPDQDIYDGSVTPATGHWSVTDMTTPDATLDIMNDGSLRVMSADGDELWRQGYRLGAVSSLELSNETINMYSFSANDTGTVNLVLPKIPAGKVTDFCLDVINPALDSTADGWPSDFSESSTYAVGDKVAHDLKIWRCIEAVSTAGAWADANWEEAFPMLSLGTALDSTVKVVVGEGKSLADIFTVKPGTMVRVCFTLTAFGLGGLPTYLVASMTVEDGGAQA